MEISIATIIRETVVATMARGLFNIWWLIEGYGI
jgi:hypothetical protein